MHNRRMVAPAEFPTDLRKGPGGQLFGEIHRDLPRTGDRAGPSGGIHFTETDIVVFGNALLDFLDRHAPIVRTQNVVQNFLRVVEGDRPPDEIGVRHEPVQRPLQFTHVGRDLVREEFEHLERDLDLHPFGFRLQDAQAQFVDGRVYIGDQPPSEPRLHAVFHAFEIVG